MQVDVFKDMNAGGAMPEREIDTGKRNGRLRLRVIRHGTSFYAAPLIWEEPYPGPASCDLRTVGNVVCPCAGHRSESGGASGQNRGAGRFAQRRLRVAGEGGFPGKAGGGTQGQRYRRG